MTKPVILTGIRSNEEPTIGNYFGAMLPLIDMAIKKSDEYQINMFIPDLHSFTTPIDHDTLFNQSVHNARLFAAAGLPLDNTNIYIYRQSYVPAHSELTWILDCFTGMGEMGRMTQFKDKSLKLHEDRISVGLFNYPVLMASDVLLYNAEYVPVGDDQSQHLEYMRDIAERMNSRFGNIFKIPKAVSEQHQFFGKDRGLRIMDLADPTKKMSKSDESGKGIIRLGEDPESAAKKIMSATTDDKACVRFDRENQPGISNLLEILSLLRGTRLEDVVKEFEGLDRYGDFKKVVADEIKEFLVNFQARLARLDDDIIFAKLEQSEKAMNEQANTTLLRVQQAVGLRARES